MAERVTNHAILNWTLYSILTIGNLFYLYWIRHLDQKKFHLMMFLILQICYGACIA